MGFYLRFRLRLRLRLNLWFFIRWHKSKSKSVMDPGIVDFLILNWSWSWIFIVCLLFLLFLSFHHFLYFFIFETLNDSDPILSKGFIIKEKVPFDVNILIFLIFHDKLYMELTGVRWIFSDRDVHIGSLIFGFRDCCFERKLFGLINVIKHSGVEVKDEESLVFEHGECGLILIGIWVMNSFAINGFGLDLFLDLSFGKFHIFVSVRQGSQRVFRLIVITYLNFNKSIVIIVIAWFNVIKSIL